jgi:short-subunit dehydrogenase
MPAQGNRLQRSQEAASRNVHFQGPSVITVFPASSYRRIKVSDLKRYHGWALITGASSGIGASIARQIAAAGVDCFLVARREDRLQALSEALSSEYNVETATLPLDLTQNDAPTILEEATKSLDVAILVNNAGFGSAGLFQNQDPVRLESMVTLNCLIPTLLTRTYLPQMLDRRCGAIITVSSVLGVVPCPYETTYSATKAFDLFLGLGLWSELRGTGVDALTVCPSTTATEFLIAEGVDREKADTLYRKADSPDMIAQIALRALGRRALVGPRDFYLFSLLSRILPRATSARLVGAGFKRFMGSRLDS